MALSHPPGGEEPVPARLLVVDDEPAGLVLVSEVLGAEGYTILTADTGEDGLARAERERPELLLLDVDLPGISGMEALQILRQTVSPEQLPVLLLTGSRDPDVIARGFQLGANDYMAKPFGIAELRARVRHHLRLKQATAEVSRLRELERLKDDFLAVVSHELRTPLTAIVGFTELLEMGLIGSTTPDQRDTLAVIGRRSRDLQRLIEDLLAFQQVRSGQRELSQRRVVLTELLDGVTGRCAEAAAEKGVALDAISPNGDEVQVDCNVLSTILDKLVDNAIKFSPSGTRVRLAARLEHDQLLLEVSDHGEGIAGEDLAAIFHAFRQLEPHQTRRAEGMGLGLAAVWHLVRLHGGRVWADSKPGRGSTFHVALPAGGAPIQPAAGGRA